MDCHNYTTDQPKHKKGTHLDLAERAKIGVLNSLHFGKRAIARTVGCSVGTVVNELRRGTPPERAQRGGSQATQKSAERRPTGPTGRLATGAQRLRSAHDSSAGSSSRYGNTNGLWTPAVAMPNSITCSSRLRWFAAVPSTTGSGKG